MCFFFLFIALPLFLFRLEFRLFVFVRFKFYLVNGNLDACLENTQQNWILSTSQTDYIQLPTRNSTKQKKQTNERKEERC